MLFQFINFAIINSTASRGVTRGCQKLAYSFYKSEVFLKGDGIQSYNNLLREMGFISYEVC